MCGTTMGVYTRPDGYQESIPKTVLCHAARNGQPCASMLNLPPTPSYTPRSGTPNYRSGDESDRSFHSGASSNSRNKRSSGVYVNGKKVLDLNRQSSKRHSRESRDNRHERVVIVDSPPTPRTPPQLYTAPHTAPSSPNTASSPYIVEASPSSRNRRQSISHQSSTRRPVIVDERANRRVQIEIEPSRGRHSREPSASSEEDSERRRRHRRREREEERAREEQEMRELRMRERIAKANAEINMRPAVPMPPAPPKRSSTYTRPAVTVPTYSADAELVEAVERMNLRESRAKRDEEEAQRRRLMERMMPRRRATVGPGDRRRREMYEDGMYRYE